MAIEAEALRAILKQHIKVDATGLSPAVASAFVTGFAEAVEAIRSALAEDTARAAEEIRARPLEEWHEDMGDVLWWSFPIRETPYVGSPLDEGRSCQIKLRLIGEEHTHHVSIGGWPGYHTHWTPLPAPPALPLDKEAAR